MTQPSPKSETPCQDLFFPRVRLEVNWGTDSPTVRDLNSAETFCAGAQVQGKQVHQDPVLSYDSWVELQTCIATRDW